MILIIRFSKINALFLMNYIKKFTCTVPTTKSYLLSNLRED